MNHMTGKDVYLRITDNKTGAQTFNHHRAWDVDRLIESQRKAYSKEGERDGDAMRFTVTLATEAQYRNARAHRA